MRHIFETAVIFVGTLGFWGFVYPELCMTEGTCETVSIEEDCAGTEDVKEPAGAGTDVYDFLNGSGEIRIKLKSVEYLYQVKEKIVGKKE